MGHVILIIVIGVLFALFAALVFALLTILLGKLFTAFEISGPDDWSFFDFYKRYLIIAAVFAFVSLPLGNGLIGIGALAAAYKFVFDAGWTQAIIMGTVGGVIALALFILMFMVILTPFGLLAQ